MTCSMILMLLRLILKDLRNRRILLSHFLNFSSLKLIYKLSRNIRNLTLIYLKSVIKRRGGGGRMGLKGRKRGRM